MLDTLIDMLQIEQHSVHMQFLYQFLSVVSQFLYQFCARHIRISNGIVLRG